VRLAFVLYVALVVLIASPDSRAQPSATAAKDQSIETLSEQANDPTASLTQAQLKEEFTPAEFGTNAQPNTALFRPILAIRPHGPMDLEQIVRPTFSLVTIPRGKAASTRTEFGDTQLLDLVVMPWPDDWTSGLRWGIGPYFVFPTATSHSAGQGAWQAGPAAAFRCRPLPGLLISALAQQATSFAYTSAHSSPVTVLTFQPMLSYQLGRGWYVRSSDATWTFNLRHGTSTTIPVSAGIGKVWKLLEGAAINASVAGEWMAYRQYASQTEQFTLKFQLTLLFPTLKL
jgi:hypothetical protein